MHNVSNSHSNVSKTVCLTRKHTFLFSDVPNSGRGLPRLPYRTEKWDPAFRAYLKSLDAKKPVIACGDLNVAHLDIGKYAFFRCIEF